MNSPGTPLFSSRNLYALIWPLITEQLLNVFVGMVDVVMVASIGEAAVSGVSLVDSVNQLLIAFLSALTAGGTVVCSQFIGKRDMAKANESAGQVVTITVTGTMILSTVFLLGGRHLLSLIFGTVEPAVMDSAALYFAITACSFPFLALYNSSAALFRAVGNSRVSMKTSLLMNGMNVAGNALCIYGLKMGVAGVAIPTLISRAVSSLVLFSLMQNPANTVRVSSLRDLLPNWVLIRRILNIGIPGGIESSLFQLGKLMLQSLVSTLGTASIAGFAVASNLVTFLYLPGNSLGLALTTVVGQCVGAGEAEQAKRYIRIFNLLDYAFLAILSTAMILLRYRLIGIYNLSPEAAQIASGLVLSHSLAMILWPLAFVTPYGLRAANDARFTMVLSIFCVWTFRVALAYLFVRGFGLSIQFVWYAMYIDWVFRVIAYELRLRKFTDRIKAIRI